jgi:hypothetical protein
MKIAVRLNSDKRIEHINDTNEDAAIEQSHEEGWILVDSVPAFSIDEKYLWTVRESDGKLVQISTMQTPDEQQNTINAEVLKQVAETSSKVDQLAAAFGAYMKASAESKSVTETTSSDGTMTNTEKVGN